MNFCCNARSATAQFAFQEIQVEVRENHFARAGKPDAVDDAGVIGFIRENDVLRSGDAAEQADIRRISGVEKQRRFRARELRQLALELLPNFRVARKEP